uniref:NADH-ubiquinone oxidoreductase chain 6 n=1 Tax=Tarbinskiellus portentosus TaxID=2732766 RepID=A0A8F9WKG6_9ORTH|nr:NADH dehydrogenase subunit 6 [Tarbinskiellus portentosus]UBU97852.1 NADH dehydrogenase subunit 6 [Tarbinskiellus sp.]DAZ85812.1 TPA_asm: NADH dehydrogenase subunit 6 [Tarbinskiellus portentosus]
MFMTLLMMFMLIINIVFSTMTHPLAITLLIIMQTMIICTITGSMSYSFWFSYILFMIFLGGMLVLFIYITSLASNEMFQLPIKTMMTSLAMTSMVMLLTIPLLPLMTNNMNKMDTLMMTFMNTSIEPNNLNQLYNYPNMNLTILTISYLLFTLIIIVKITSIQEGPLRQSN